MGVASICRPVAISSVLSDLAWSTKQNNLKSVFSVMILVFVVVFRTGIRRRILTWP